MWTGKPIYGVALTFLTGTQIGSKIRYLPDITRDKRYDLSPGEGRSLAGRFEVIMAATKNQHHNDMGPY